MPITDAEVIDVLPTRPSTLLDVLAYLKPQTDAPMAYGLGVALSLIAVTAHRDLSIRYAGPPMHGNIFVLLAGRSGEDRKSSAAFFGRQLLTRIAPEIAVDPPGSDEGLVDSLELAPTQLIVFSEFGGFLKRAEEGYFEKLKTRLNSLFDCQEGTRNLAGGKRRGHEHPRVSILGPCALPYLEAHTNAVDWTGGFMGRWLVLHAHRSRILVFATDPDPMIEQRIVDTLTARAQLPNAGRCLGMNSAARRIFEPWFHDVSNRSLPEFIVGARARVPTFAVKIALLMGWDFGGGHDGQPWEVEEEATITGMKIAELHLKSVVEIAAILCENKDMRDRRRVLNAIADAGHPMTFGEIIERAKLLKRRTHDVLDTLVEEGNVVAVRAGDKTGYVAINRALTDPMALD